jgi:dTMP kinase
MAFITFEGIEGSGKSTQAARLVSRLGPSALLTREPGGTALGRAVRGLLLDVEHHVTPRAELLLFFADRAQHVEEVVRPALAAGRVVVSDRYWDSTLAYQGYGRGLGRGVIEALAAIATGGLRPDLIVLMDVSVHEGLARIRRRPRADRLEGEEPSFHQRVRDGYLAMASAEPARWLVVDAEGPADHVAEAVWERVCGLKGGNV